MNRRMTLATGVVAVALLVTSGCTLGSDGAKPGVSPSVSESATPTAPKTLGKADLPGDWKADQAQWVVHFNEDGTFIEDFHGIVNFRVGTYEVNGETVTLNGGDGNTSTGTITGVTLVFRLGTLTRS